MVTPGAKRSGDGRQRDVFPLPKLFEEGGVAKKGMSRSVQRRVLRRDAVQKRVNMAIDALNSMYLGGRHRGADQCKDLRLLPRVQRDAISHIMMCVRRCGKPPSGASYSGAIDALRVTSGSYQDDSIGLGDTVRMKLDILSLPTLSGGGVALDKELGGDAAGCAKLGCSGGGGGIDEALQRSSAGLS